MRHSLSALTICVQEGTVYAHNGRFNSSLQLSRHVMGALLCFEFGPENEFTSMDELESNGVRGNGKKREI